VLSAGNPGATYLWSTNANTQTINVTQSGTYAVTVTALGCPATDSVTVTINALPQVDLGPNQTTCLPLTLDAGNPGASYLWSTTETTQTISVVPPTTGSQVVSVTVTSPQGCETTDQITLFAGVPPVVNLGPDAAGCDSVLLTADVLNVSYLWSTGATTQSIFATASGTYSVTVSDAQGCEATDQIVVTVSETPEAAASFENNDYDFTINFVNQSTPAAGATYSWDFGDGSAASSAASPVHTYQFPGSYLVTLTVRNECGVDTVSFVVGGVNIDEDAFARAFTVSPNPNTGVFCLMNENIKAEALVIDVIDTHGRVIQSETQSYLNGELRHKIDLTRHAEGLYTLRISDGLRTVFKHVVRE
jgi:hypothetical protein